MMGRRERGQGRLFYAFDLDKVVRRIIWSGRSTACSILIGCTELAPYYSHTGRPSIDPVLMIRMLIVGYMFAIRSERRLCSEVQVNLAYRWFCKLGIEDRIPDHSVFSRARHERFRQSDALRRGSEGVVAKCIAAGLVGGEGFSIDASLIRADAGKKKRVPSRKACLHRIRAMLDHDPLVDRSALVEARMSVLGSKAAGEGRTKSFVLVLRRMRRSRRSERLTRRTSGRGAQR